LQKKEKEDKKCKSPSAFCLQRPFFIKQKIAFGKKGMVCSKGESLAFLHLNPDPHGYKKSKKLCLHDQTLLLQLIK
jgi:hypothetical protein